MIFGIITARMLASRHYPLGIWECDGVELRADGLTPADTLPAVRAFAAEKNRRGFTGPVIFTLRLRRDGGAWEDARSRERETLWIALAASSKIDSIPLCDIVDVEIEEAEYLASPAWETLRENLREKKIKVMLSHHAFVSEVPEDAADWDKQLAAMGAFAPDAVKFAVMPGDAQQTQSLLRFARKVAGQYALSCVLGMGEAGQATRVISPLLGCPITYAYLEGEPVAPGQLPVRALRACLSQTEGRPALEATEEEWIRWAQQSLQKFGHA